jgi:hypothetical protein
MLSTTYLVVTFSFGLLVNAFAHKCDPTQYLSICTKITASIPTASQVFYPSVYSLSSFDRCQSDMREDSSQYIADNEHAWISSSAVSACSVEPGSAADVGAIVWRLLSYLVVLPHHLVSIVTHLGIHPHAFRGEGRWPCLQS